MYTLYVIVCNLYVNFGWSPSFFFMVHMEVNLISGKQGITMLLENMSYIPVLRA